MTADERTIEDFVQGLGDKPLACRRLGHPWRHHTVKWDNGGLVEVLICPSCRTQRVDSVNSHGHVLSRRYVYAEGYQAQHVTGGVKGNRDLFRLEALTRLVEKMAEPEKPKARTRSRRLRAV